MEILRIYPTSINERFIAEAATALGQGQNVVFPTDSMYAVGCDALDNRAVERLCRLKGTDPRKDLLSVMCADISTASEYARIDNRAFRYLREYLPGAVTFILPAASTLPKIFKGRRTVGIRVSANPIAEALCKAFGRPIAVTSARAADPSLSGEPEALAPEYARAAAILLDGGSIIAEPSTIVDLTDSSDPTVVREGAITFEP